MAHAATALRWQYGELSAVVTSIGPGAMQAFAGSLAAASNGVGVYHIYGDETTFGEGYNMQQVPKEEQGLFGRMTAIMGQSYVLHTPEGMRDALRRGALMREPSLSRRAVLFAAATQHPAGEAHRQSRRAAGAAVITEASTGRRRGDRAGGGDDREGRESRDQGRRRYAWPRCGDTAASRDRGRSRGIVAGIDRSVARRTCAKHACRRLERDQSAAITPWPRRNYSSSSARAQFARPIARASATRTPSW